MDSSGKNRGFTLTEVVVVIAVAAIMMTVAIPSILAWRPNLNFRQASRDFFLDLQAAKMEAAKRNVNVGVVLNDIACPAPGNPVPSPGGSYILFLDDGSGAGDANDRIRHNDEPIIRNVTFPQNVAFCGNTFGASGTIISFQPNGIPDFPPASVPPYNLTIQNDTGRQGTITVSIAGNIQLN